MDKSKKITVIGAGFSGLSAANFFARDGYDVTLVEKNEMPGGRARKFSTNGFSFDMGPSWYWLPDVFESFFANFGTKVSDYYDLVRLDPSYRVFFGEHDYLDVPAKLEDFYQMCDSLETGSGERLQGFIDEAKYKYKVAVEDLVYKPGVSFLELMDWKFVEGYFKVDLFMPIRKHIKKFIKNKRLQTILEFPVLFLGATPQNTPALYSFMNYADIALGTWYPMGGMNEIAKGMAELAKSQGVKFMYNTNVTAFHKTDGKITAVITNQGMIQTDLVIASADYNHCDKELLEESDSNYSKQYWDNRTMSPSGLIFYLGINKKINNILHHNLFFDESFDKHAEEIYTNPRWPSKPLFYVSATSKTDPGVAPEGMENIFILVPVATGLEDSDETREAYFNDIMDRLEKHTGENIRDHIIYKRSYAHKDFKQDYNAFKGNAYGLANTLLQTHMLKPSIRSKKIKNLLYTGQLTVPGPGVPPSIISGEVVYNYAKDKVLR